MNLAPPLPRFGRPVADPDLRERERVKETRRGANQKPAKDLPQALQRERHAPDYTILVVVVALAAIGILMVYSSSAMRGYLSADADTWRPDEPLDFDTTYTWSGWAVGDDGERSPIAGSFATVKPKKLVKARLNVADGEIRGQATVGGNLCAGQGAGAPRGDLQGAFLALGATARSAGAGGERSEPLEEFLDVRHDRLLLDVSFEKPAASAFAALDYPHTHEYTVLAVTGARAQDGTVRLAATGLADHGRRLPSAEAAAADPEAAGAAALEDVTLGDDALASAWYRSRTLPVLVRRVLTQLQEAS